MWARVFPHSFHLFFLRPAFSHHGQINYLMETKMKTISNWLRPAFVVFLVGLGILFLSLSSGCIPATLGVIGVFERRTSEGFPVANREELDQMAYVKIKTDDPATIVALWDKMGWGVLERWKMLPNEVIRSGLFCAVTWTRAKRFGTGNGKLARFASIPQPDGKISWEPFCYSEEPYSGFQARDLCKNSLGRSLHKNDPQRRMVTCGGLLKERADA